MTRSGSSRARLSGSWSATSWGAASAPRRPWASCAAPCARWRRPGSSPGALLEALSEFCRRHGVGQMATVAYAEIDVRLGSMRYACAGHPPPVIVEPADAAWFASEGRSPPLDAHSFWSDRPEGACQLPAGAMVVLYSDGLIERSDRPLRAGLDELLTMIDRLRDEAPDTVASVARRCGRRRDRPAG